jgi:hypothetical protein
MTVQVFFLIPYRQGKKVQRIDFEQGQSFFMMAFFIAGAIIRSVVNRIPGKIVDIASIVSYISVGIGSTKI